MAEETINPLRRRMIEDMTIRNFDQRTQQSYLRAVRSCCRYCERRVEDLTFDDVRRYQLHLGQCAFPWPCCGGHMRLIEVFERGAQPRASFTPKVVGVDSS